MRRKKNNKKVYILIGILFSICLVFVLINFFKKTYENIYQQSLPSEVVVTPAIINKIYHSKFLKITITLPTDFYKEERFGTITLKKNGYIGEIILTSIGTNENSLEQYIADDNGKLSTNNIRNHVTINGLKSIETILEYPSNPSLNHKGYAFYINHTVYSIYTFFPSLYNDLDQI